MSRAFLDIQYMSLRFEVPVPALPKAPGSTLGPLEIEWVRLILDTQVSG